MHRWGQTGFWASANLISSIYPFTLIFENDSTAVPVVGRPIESAGRNVVKINAFFTTIAKGLVPPPTAAELALSQGRPAISLVRRRANIRLTGIVLLGAAAGLILFFVALAAILQERDVLCGAACGLIPFGIGVGFLIDTRIQTREIDESTPPPANHPFAS